MKNIILYTLIGCIVLIIVHKIVGIIIILYKAFSKNDESRKSIDNLDTILNELSVYRELNFEINTRSIKNTPKTRIEYITNKISRARTIFIIKKLSKDVKDFNKSIKNCYYLDTLAGELEGDKEDKNIVNILKDNNNKVKDKINNSK